MEHAPRLLEFFLQFLLRNNVLPELKPKLLMALSIIEKAKIELPATANIGQAVPDEFSKACSTTWGLQEGLFISNNVDWNVDTLSPIRGREKEEIIQIKTEEVIRDETPAPQPDMGDSWGIEEVLNKDGEPIKGWGWDGDDGANPWIEAADEILHDWETPGPPISFISYFGPNPIERSFAHQYRAVLVEDSLRSIEKIYAPGEFVSDSPTWEIENLSVVILKPWKKPKESPLRNSEIREIPQSRGESTARSSNDISEGDDTRSKKIRVLVSPEVGRLLIEGMILGGLFVKIVEMQPEDGQEPKEWWYVEKLLLTLPSYYKELNAEFINNLLQLA